MSMKIKIRIVFFCWICTPLLFYFCHQCNSNKRQNGRAVTPLIVRENLQRINCGSNAADTFGQIKLNGLLVSQISKSSFLKHYPEYDSIDEDGYFYYRKSKLLFDAQGLVCAEILDTNIYFNDFLNLNTSVQTIRSRFPCSYANRGLEEYDSDTYESLQIFNADFSMVTIYLRANKVSMISYSIDENP